MNEIAQPMLHPLAKAVLAVALLSSLSGCVGLVIGGAVAGAAATADRRTLGAQTDDKAIAVKAEMKLPALTGKYGHVNVNTYNRQVLLTGEVQDEAMKSMVEREVKAIPGVTTVANELEITSPATYTSRSNDTLITTKVKASLVDMKTISATSFKVITERGIVYMMGRVTEREGQVAADVARGVSGVSKVVKVFDYITEDEMRTLSPNAKVEL